MTDLTEMLAEIEQDYAKIPLAKREAIEAEIARMPKTTNDYGGVHSDQWGYN